MPYFEGPNAYSRWKTSCPCSKAPASLEIAWATLTFCSLTFCNVGTADIIQKVIPVRWHWSSAALTGMQLVIDYCCDFSISAAYLVSYEVADSEHVKHECSKTRSLKCKKSVFISSTSPSAASFTFCIALAGLASLLTNWATEQLATI